MEELRCILDYETRSRLNLKLTSATEYAKHPSTSIFCIGYKINDRPKKLWIPERGPMPPDLWECFQRGIMVAQNAGFERAITRHTLTRYETLTREQRWCLYEMQPSRWRCTAAKAAACSLPRSLELGAQVLELPTQKDMHGHKLIQKYSKPRKPSKNNPALWWSDRKDLRDIYRYCLIDVQAEYELDQALPDLTDDEQRVWELDQIINERGILIDIPTVKIIIGMIHEEIANITMEVRKLSKGTIEKVTQGAKVLAWLNARGAEMGNLRAETIRDKLLSEDLPDEVRQMLEYRQGGSKSSTAKYIKMIHAVGDDHRARELLLYWGTLPTGRWAGKRIQPHNFPRPTVKGFNSDEAIELIKANGVWGVSAALNAVRKRYGKTNVMPVLVSAIRGMIIASPGKELFCADFAAIEARIAFWVAEHEEGIRAFIEERKLYEEMAAETFGKSLEWLCSKEGKESLERFVGKESVLGAQYGLGWKMFMVNCHKKGMPKVTAEIAKKAIYTYRKVHHPVPEMWKKLELAAVQAIKNPGKRYRVTKVVIYTHGNFLIIKLPSGRKLKYFKPRISQKQLAGGRLVPQIHHWTVWKKSWVETTIWGGILFNHIVQGIARDLMMCGTANIEGAGYEFILSVHDEALAEREKGKGSPKEFLDLMAGQLPQWAQGAPVKAEGWVGPRYRK